MLKTTKIFLFKLHVMGLFIPIFPSLALININPTELSLLISFLNEKNSVFNFDFFDYG